MQILAGSSMSNEVRRVPTGICAAHLHIGRDVVGALGEGPHNGVCGQQ